MGRFLHFLIPQSVSLLGSSVLQFAIIWTVVFSYGSGSMMLLTTLLGFLPQIIVSLLIGPLLDRYSKKLVIMISDGLSAAAAILILPSILSGDVSSVFPMLLVRSAAQGIQAPAYDAVLPLLVPEERLVRANGIKGLMSSVMMLLSPALAALLYSSSYGLIYAIIFDASTALIAIASLLFQRLPGIKAGERIDLLSGLRYCREDSSLLKLIIFNAVAVFSISPGAFLTPLLLSREYDASSALLSISEISYSAGMITGGLAIASIGDRLKGRRGYGIALMLYGLCLILMGTIRGVVPYIILNAIIGISTPSYTALLNAEVQSRTEESMMGRVMALLSASSSVALPLGMILFGPLADIIPIRTVFMLSGVIASVIAICGRR